ncbi:hypothetical protein F2Q69_00007920 [Brassica cretica]|uniref:DUF627 domain-containing protein n=1 Tax=Brassica cretica TaxID=69181 RepID=A0A8S9NZP5_BRACR|nr:hypothetical protein F2Q69_00007920 [Brassica cretica]
MGQKKKPPAPRSKQSLSSSAAEAEPSSEVSACTSYDGDEPSNLAEIKVECEKALTSFRRGSYNKAIRLMKESCSRHQHSALIHRVQGTVCVKVSSVYEDAVCYYGQHYHCFAYSHEHDRWIMYDDKTVKVIGSWSDVLSMCKKGRLQPQLLLYEKQR